MLVLVSILRFLSSTRLKGSLKGLLKALYKGSIGGSGFSFHILRYWAPIEFLELRSALEIVRSLFIAFLNVGFFPAQPTVWS